MHFPEEDPDTAGRSGIDVHYNPESICKYGIWNSCRNFILPVGIICDVTSSIALTESAVSTFEDEIGWGRKSSRNRNYNDCPWNIILSWIWVTGICKNHWNAVLGFL